MICPADNTPLMMSDRQGVEIDYCPNCRGVWLDRGELDKIIERNESYETRAQSQPTQFPHTDTPKNNYGKKHKRESFLGDLFDF